MLVEPYNTICVPAQIHIVYLVIYIAVHVFSVPIMHSISTTVIGLALSWIINWICRRGYRWISWAVVIILFSVEVPPLLSDIYQLYVNKTLKLNRASTYNI